MKRLVRQASGLPVALGGWYPWTHLLALLTPYLGAYSQWLLWDLLRPYAFLFFYPSLYLSSWLGGLRIGLASWAISVLLVWYIFVPTEMSFSIDGRSLFAVGVNATIGMIFLQMHQRLRQTNRALFQTNLNTEERMAGIVHSAMDAIVSVDAEQRIVLFNAAAEKLFGLSAQEVTGSRLERLIPERYRADHRDHMAGFSHTSSTSRSMRSQRPLLALRANGQEFPIEASISQTQVGNEKIFTVILRDISERLQAEAIIKVAEHRLRAVTENLMEGLIISDPSGGIQHWNRAALSMHQLTEPSLELQDTFRLLTLEAQELSPPEFPLARVLAGQALRELDLRISRRQETWERVFRYSGAVAEGIAFLSIADITEQVRAQEQVRQLNQDLERKVEQRTTELQAANKELEAFSYSVSHDLRSPLRAMDGFSRATLEDYGDLLPAEGQDYLHTICKSAQRMGHLIDDLLAFARLNRMALRQHTVPTQQLVTEVVAEVSGQYQDRQVDLTVDPLPDCLGDASLLRQAWLNLIHNAYKYTAGKSPAQVHIGTVGSEEKPTFFVKDNGAGFDMRYVEKLFGVFQRLHRAEDYPGTGVGLAIVQRIVQRHGGRVWAEGQVDRGACFYFTLEEARPDVAA